MDNPESAIAQAVSLITAASSPDVQKKAIEQFFTEDAGFRHPICHVDPQPGSRQQVIGIYQWYRVMSPKIDLKVNQTFYNPDTLTLILDVEQTFHIRFSPFPPCPTRLLVKLKLRKIDNKYYIAFQEDFYHTDDFAKLVIPPLAPLIRLALKGATVVSGLNAWAASLVGVWAPSA